MREVNFRAWDKVNKIMVYPTEPRTGYPLYYYWKHLRKSGIIK